VTLDDSEHVVGADLVISAVGQTPDLGLLGGHTLALNEDGTIKVEARTLETSEQGVFAGGDCVTGPATVVEAVAAGRRAALAIDRHFGGASWLSDPVALTIPYKAVDVDVFKARERQAMPVLPVKERAGSFAEVERGFDAQAAGLEVVRCFQCGMFPKVVVDEVA
jgi:formate dehydrogenase major subunit